MPKMKITKDTTLCISVATRPGNFGTILMNAAFEKNDLDFLYKAMQVKEGQLERALAGVRALGIRGCGVSMPFKMEAAELVDSLDPWAEKIGAINTIVNTNGNLKGYNTDAYGAYQVLKAIKGLKSKSVIMVGAGGVARAICAALIKIGVKDVTIVNKDKVEAESLAERWKFKTALWGRHEVAEADLFINATPIGMKPNSGQSPLTEKAVDNYKIIMDVVIYPNETKLMKLAKKQKKRLIQGLTMSLNQSARQFELYTDKKAPIGLMKELITSVK